MQAHELSLVLAQVGVGEGATVLAELGVMRDPLVGAHLDLAAPNSDAESRLPGYRMAQRDDYTGLMFSIAAECPNGRIYDKVCMASPCTTTTLSCHVSLFL